MAMKKKTKKMLTYGLIGYGIFYFMKKDQEKKQIAAAVNSAAAQTAQSGLGTYLTIGY